MIYLTQEQIDSKIEFIKNYMKADNAADGSYFDPNANVSSKNIATLASELNKDINIQVNRELVSEKLKELYGKDIAEEYVRQIKDHEIYVHDETSMQAYCASITLYPFLIDGMTKLGGESKAPKNLNSFCGSFINLVFACSSQLAGAIATVEFLMYFDHFAKRNFGEDYLKTNTRQIMSSLQHVIYSLNQPAAARGYQAVFWNISIFDEHYFKSMFGDFRFPDGTKSSWNSVSKLQEFFMEWFNSEREKSLLTFPIVTAAMLINEKDNLPKDKGFLELCSKEMSEGNAFFIYQSKSVDSLSSCCFEGKEIIQVYNTITKENEIISIKDFVEKFNSKNHENIFNTKYKIKSLNPDTLNEEMVKITGTLKKDNDYVQLIEIECDNKILRVTPDHIFLVKLADYPITREVTAEKISWLTYSYLLPIGGNKKTWKPITDIKMISFNGPVYDIQLEKNHYFKANMIYTHNCRLRNEIQDNTFSYTLGAGGVSTGSINVITINMNRLIQENRDLLTEIKKIHKYQSAHRSIIQEYIEASMMSIYSAGFIDLNKQYLTIGINGMVEAAEFLGITPGNNDEYRDFVQSQLKIIYDANKQAKKEYGYMFNTEFIPGESCGVKHARWDKKHTIKKIKITLETDKILELNENSNILLENGKIIKAKDLNVNDEISMRHL